MTANYPVPSSSCEVCYEIKKSRFIAFATFADTRESAMQRLAEVKQKYPDARHHCWAYQFGNPKSAASAAMSDDGEPSGTAGKPILNVLQHKNVGDIMIIVTRYFGGVKLGAGGLVRAYSAAAQMAMEALKTEQQVARELLELSCGFGDEQLVRHWLSQHDGVVENIEYRDQVVMTIALPLEHSALFRAYAASIGGQIINDN
ncbi:YigZ family protein [Alkalimarinus sediminis]|uniref:YigZ family protein n=1 Tax=Alkalimarinus sediminis TaxID=1632866 RepID=A0A9E8HIT4_9ALTE|nr:YigZ family protein [Alkalimarinus sediminis]UZW75174.1 YigZ family protein [Alkalimarinus sediminis]